MRFWGPAGMDVYKVNQMCTDPHHVSSDLTYVRQILSEGTNEAREVVAKKVTEIKQIMKLVY